MILTDSIHPTHRSRTLDIPGAVNVRDLHGIELAGARTLAPGQVVRGEAPFLLGAEGVQALLGMGVRTVIDLRGSGEVQEQGDGALAGPIARGDVVVHRVNFVPSVEWRLTPQGQDPYRHLDEAYLQCLLNGAAALVAALADGLARGGVYIHCAIGKDRTGVTAAVLLTLLGAARADVLADYEMTALGMPSLVARLQGSPFFPEFTDPDWSLLRPRVDVLDTLLDRLCGGDGPESWLVAAGADANALAAVRAAAAQ